MSGGAVQLSGGVGAVVAAIAAEEAERALSSVADRLGDCAGALCKRAACSPLSTKYAHQ